MALGGKTVQYTLQVDLETGKLTAGVAQMSNAVARARGNVDKEFRMMSNSARGFGGALTAVFGVLTLRQAKQWFRELTSFAETHQTAITQETIRMKNAYNAFLTGVVESKLWGQITTAIANSLTFVAVLLQNKTAWDAFWDSAIYDFQLKVADGMEWLVNKLNFLGLFETQVEQAALMVDELKRRSTAAAGDFSAAFASGLSGLRAPGEIQKQENKPDESLTVEAIQLKEAISLYRIKQETAAMVAKEELQIANQIGQRKKEYLQNELDFYFAAEEEKLALMEQQQAEIDSLNSGAFQTFVNGMVDGFAAIGESLVNGTNGLKGFGAMFLKTIAQIAIQFGTFIMLTGLAKNSLPEIFGLSGAAAVAAGAALVVFGGALGAIASKIGGGSGRGAASEREQRFRDSRFGTNGGNGGTTIINNINFANTIGLTRDSMKEVGEIISKELFKQEKLGRIETVG